MPAILFSIVIPVTLQAKRTLHIRENGMHNCDDDDDDDDDNDNDDDNTFCGSPVESKPSEVTAVAELRH